MRFASAGVKRGDRVAFLSLNCHRLLEAYYGVLEAGGILLPLNIRLAAPELVYILNHSGAAVLFLEQEFVGLVDSFRRDLQTVRSFYQLDGTAASELAVRSNLRASINLRHAVPRRIDGI